MRHLTLAAMALSAVSALAHVHSNKLPLVPRYLPEPSDSALIYNALIDNAPAEFTGNVAKIQVTSPYKRFILGVGGYVRASAAYDFGSPIDNPCSFITSEIPFNPGPNKGKVQFSAQTTSLYANFVANPGEKQVGAFIGLNLTGENYMPEVQYAYVRYRGVQAGYDYTLFSDPSVAPPSIDYQGPNSYLAISSIGVRYTRSFGKTKSWEWGVAAEKPQASFVESVEMSQRIPDIPAYIRYQWDNMHSWVRLAAIMRNFNYRRMDGNGESTRYTTGWGLSVSGNLQIVPDRLTFLYQATYGHGISSYFQDIEGMNLDLSPKGEGGLYKPTPGWGGFFGMQYNFTDRLFSSITYSHVRLYDVGYDAGNYRYGQYALANLFYDINSWLQWGVEYIYGRRVNADGAQQHDNRLQTMLQFSF